MSPTILNVVYAGRGDALILRDDPDLYLIDGGPEETAPQRFAFRSYWQIYWESLLAVAGEMPGRQVNPLAPDGIVISHAHSDHYGGIVGVFGHKLSKQIEPPPGAKPLFFDGPLISQALRNPRDTDFAALDAVFQDFEFDLPAGQRPVQGPLGQRFTFSAAANAYSLYERPVPALPAKVWSVDTSDANLASVLIAHQSGIVFTGDSAGYLVLPFIESAFPDGEFSIFKVPHHGSLRNSQRGQLIATVPVAAWRQYGLLCIAIDEDEWETIEMPSELQEPGDVDAARQLLADLCARSRVDFEELRDELFAAYAETAENIEAGDDEPFVLIGRSGVARRLWTELEEELKTRKWLTRDSGGGGKRLRRDNGEAVPSWLTRLTPANLSSTYYGLLCAYQLKGFFSSFYARDHVISANGTYAHPCAETLAGIASGTAQKTRVWVTDGSAVNLSRLRKLNPDWQDSMELRALAHGDRVRVDPTKLPPAGEADADESSVELVPVATLEEVIEQIGEGGIEAPSRTVTLGPYALRVVGQPGALYLNLDPHGSISLGPAPQSLLVEQAWLLDSRGMVANPFPGTFDDIRLAIADAPTGSGLQASLVITPSGHELSVLWLFDERQYVCNDPSRGFLTTNPEAESVVAFEFVAPGAAGQAPAPLAASAEEPVKLRDFCTAVGVPIDQPLDCGKLLPQLVGPDAAAGLDAQILSEVIERVLGWDADLDKSTVTYRVDDYGPLVSAAEIVIDPGTPLGFDIAQQPETIDTSALSLARDPEADAVAITGSLLTAAGTSVADSGKEVDPPRTRPLDQYLHDIGVPIAEWPAATCGTLLTAMVGALPSAAQLLLTAPSFLVTAGIGRWLVDHEASVVATQRTVTGDYTELRWGRIVLATPANLSQQVGDLTISVSEVSLAVERPRLPTATVALELVAEAESIRLEGRARLDREAASLQLDLPATDGFADLAKLLSGNGPGVGAMQVPLAGQKLEGAGLKEPWIEVSQPSLGAEPYLLAAAGGSVAIGAWRQGLPAGWPAQGDGSATVRVLDPLDSTERLVAVEVPFLTPVGAAEVESVLRAEPLRSAPPDWSYSVVVLPDPASQPLTATELLGAVGLADPGSRLAEQLPALAPALGELAVERLVLALAPGSTDPAAGEIEIELAGQTDWTLVPGIVAVRPTAVMLSWRGGRWKGEVEGEGPIGPVGPVAVSAQLATPELPGAASFENAGEELTVAALASLCGLGDLSAVPVVGELSTAVVAAVELFSSPGSISLTAVGFSAAIEPRAVGVFELAWASIEVDRNLPGGSEPDATGFWLEAQWGSDLIVSLLYDDAVDPKIISGQLRPIATVKLGDLLTRLLGEAAKALLLSAVGEMAIAAGTSVQRGEGFELTACGASLSPAAALSVANASAGQLSARWVAEHENEKGEKVPVVYALDGRLTREKCKYEAALEMQFKGDEKAQTVAGTIRAIPTREGESEEEKEAKKFTVTTLLELLDLERPQVLTPKGAPEFFELEPTAVEATFSVDPFRLEALTVLVRTDKTLALLAAPQPIELEHLTLRVDYVREPKQGEPKISGVVLGELPLPPKAVTLAYTEPKGEEAAFRAKLELKEEEAPNYRELVANEPYSPGYGVPDEPGLPRAIPMTSLTATARPGEYVELSGYDPQTLWALPIGGLTIDVNALGGRVRVTPGESPDAPHRFDLSLFGRLEYRGFVGAEALFTWGPKKPSLLTAEASEKAGDIDLAAVATDLGSRWEDLVPTGTPALAFTTAWTYVDLTDPKAIALDLYGDGSLGAVAGPAALLSQAGEGARRNEFLFGAASTSAFPLTPLWQPLGEIVDDYLSLAAGNLAALSETGTTAGLEADLTTLREAVKRQAAKYTPPFADLPSLAEALPPGTELGRALTLVAKLDSTGSGSLSGALARIAEADSLGTRLAWGPIDHDAPERSRLEVDLRGLALLGGGVTVEAVAEYVPSKIEALIAESTTARVEVGSSTYDFVGRLIVEAEEANFATRVERDPIPAPLGATGTSFRNPIFVAIYRYPPSQPLEQRLRIGAFVDLAVAEGGVERGITCDAAIEFSNGQAAVALFTVPQTIQVIEVYANRMTSGEWPSGYPSFALEAPRFHAAPQAVTIEGTEYEAGYHALATAPFFTHPFPFDLTIEAAGLKGKGASDSPVDLIYLTVGDPEIEIATGASPAFALSGSARVFGGDFGEIEFEFDAALGKWTGSAQYGQKLVEVEKPTVRFAYEEKAGLRLLEWPVKPKLDEDDDFDWEEELEEASEGSKCGKLEDLGLDDGENEDKTIETQFDLTLEQVVPLADEALTLALRGTYTVIVKESGGEETKTTMPFPETIGTIGNAGTFPLGDLEEWVKETIENNHEQLGKSLLEERDSDGEPGLESFLEGFDFDEAEAELLERILCREEGPEKVRTATEKKLKETEEKSTGKETEAKHELEKVKTETTISVAFGFLITFFAWFTIAFGWLSGLFGLFGVAKWWLPVGLRREWEEAEEKAKQTKEEGEEIQVWAETELLKMRGVLAVAFTDLTTVEVSWDRENLPAYPERDYGNYEGFSFEVEVATDSGFEEVVGTTTVDSPATSASISGATLGTSNYAFARVRAIFRKYPGTWIIGREFHRVPLPAPAAVSQLLNPAAEAVEVVLTTVIGARIYTVELVDTTTGSVVAEAKLAAPDRQPPKLVQSLAPASVGDGPPLLLLGRAKASGDPTLNEDSPFTSAPEDEVIPTVGPPRNVAASLVPDGVQVTWDPFGGATVTTQVRDSQGVPLSPQPDSKPIPNGCLLSGPGIVDGAELRVAARAEAPASLEPWSAAVPFTARVLPPPQGLSVLFLWPENQLEVSWARLSGEEYEIELLDALGNRLDPKVEPQPWGAALSGAGIGPGKFTLRVRAIVPERISTWTGWLFFASEALPAPTGLSLTYAADQIAASWMPVANALVYPIELEGGDGQRAEAEPVSPSFSFGLAEGIEPQASIRYEAALRARVGDCLSAIAKAAMTMPTLLEIAERGWAGERPVEPLAIECLKLETALGPTQLTYTLLGAGYSSAEAAAGVRAALPNTTLAEMAAIGAALLERASAFERLRAEKASVAVIVALCRALFSPVPMQLAVQMKQRGFDSTGLASAFAAAFAMPAAEAAAMVTAIFAEPWHFGAIAPREGAGLPLALLLLKTAWPETNGVVVETLAALKEAPYPELEFQILLGFSPVDPGEKFTVPWQAVHGETNGVLLAELLREAKLGREEATRCVAACWPQLTPAEVAAAIEKAYGPAGPEKDSLR
jgi:glyoxylase-like metal-dependent hydrolase (beta-lactamase superfamily II)